MNVELPDGTTVRDVPDGTSRSDLAAKLKRNGMNVPDSWMAKGTPAIPTDTREELGLPPAAPSAQAPQGKEPSTMDSLIAGAPEAAATMASAIPAGAIGNIAGFVRALTSGKFGTDEAMREGAKTAGLTADALTIEPRSEYGKKAVRTVGELMNESKLAGLNPSMPVGSLMRGEGALAREGVKDTARVIGQASEEIAEVPKPRVPEQPAMAGVGSAETDVARMRRERASSLPVPLKLTKGQAERDFGQQRFERETAKSEKYGKELREHFGQNTQDILANFDAFVDQTGAQAPTLRGAGQAVDEALVSKAKRAKGAINEAYDKARTAGEMQELVDTSSLTAYIEKNWPAAINAPILTSIEQKLQQLGGGKVPERLSVNDMEELRKFIGQVTGNPSNVPFAIDAKKVIDAATEDRGGPLYREARRLRTGYAREFEDHAITDKLLSNKPGTRDRAVAFEDVFKHSVLDGSLDDVRHLRRVLQTEGPKGTQAWKELQGQTVQYLKDQATKSVSLDQSGNRPVSPAALDKAVRTLDADGKLDLLFGKQGAQQIRDVNDLAKDVFATPSGVVNSSNNASILMDVIDMAGHATGVPVGRIARATSWLKDWRKSRDLTRRVREAIEEPAT